MSRMPPRDDEPEEIDAQYRKWSSADSARPAESVGAAVVAHAARLAAERSLTAAARITNRRFFGGWKLPAFAGLAAAGLAGLVLVPRLFTLDPSVTAREVQRMPQEDAAVALAPAPAPSSGYAVPQPPVAVPSPAPRVPPRMSAAPADPPANSVNAQSAPYPASAASAPAGQSLQISSDLQNVIVSAAKNSSRQSDKSSDASAVANASAIPARAAAAVNQGELLRRSADSGDSLGVATLLDEKVDIESRDAAGRTALMLAVINGREEVVAALLARGADPNVTDSYGETPLHAAIEAKHFKIVAELQRAGAH